jgi:hypothetical protein
MGSNNIDPSFNLSARERRIKRREDRSEAGREARLTRVENSKTKISSLTSRIGSSRSNILKESEKTDSTLTKEEKNTKINDLTQKIVDKQENDKPLKYLNDKIIANSKALWQAGDQGSAADLFDLLDESSKAEYLKEHLTVRRVDKVIYRTANENQLLSMSTDPSEKDQNQVLKAYMTVVGDSHDLFFKAADKSRTVFLANQIEGASSYTGGGIAGTYYPSTNFMTALYRDGNFSSTIKHELVHALDYADGRGDGSLSGIKYDGVMNQAKAKIRQNNGNFSGLSSFRLNYAVTNSVEFLATMATMFFDQQQRPSFKQHFPELTEIFEKKFA